LTSGFGYSSFRNVAQRFAFLRGTVAGPFEAIKDWEELGRAQSETFGTAMPATAFIVVAALVDLRWLVEVEADAMLPEGSCTFIIGTCRPAGTFQPEP
jgi:enamine deaminase RidA (YjgF/YER057c/UK114 family)